MTPQQIANKIQQYRTAIQQTHTSIAQDQGILQEKKQRLAYLIGSSDPETVRNWLQEVNDKLNRLYNLMDEKIEHIRREFPL